MAVPEQKLDKPLFDNSDRAYEALKRAWVREHPDASPEEYQDAMKKIAEKVGL